MITTWFAVAIAFIASSVLAQQLAQKRGRDGYFYFFAGLFTGPVALLIVLTPFPSGTDRRSEIANRPIRTVKGQPCPECGRSVGPRASVCPYCRASLETAWWDNPVSMGQS